MFIEGFDVGEYISHCQYYSSAHGVKLLKESAICKSDIHQLRTKTLS